jgi:hypothetical protein
MKIRAGVVVGSRLRSANGYRLKLDSAEEAVTERKDTEKESPEGLAVSNLAELLLLPNRHYTNDQRARQHYDSRVTLTLFRPQLPGWREV